MVNLFRRFQQPLLIILTVFVIIAFVVLYGGPGTRLDKLGSDRIATIYDRSVQPAEYTSIGRQFEVCRMLGMFDLIIPLSQNARTMADVTENYVWNTMVLRHEAKELGIEPTEDQIAEAIKRLPAFQTKGQYDHARYLQALQFVFTPRGMTSTHLEELVRDSLRMQAIHDILGAGYVPAADELEAAYVNQHQKIEAAVVRIARDDIAKGVQVPEDEIQKAYEARKETLKTPEKRAVEYVTFSLPEKEKEGPAPSAEDLQKVADKADDFAAALLVPEAKFAEVAKRFNIEVKKTAAFAMGDRLAEFGNQPRVSAAAFQLSKERPFSDTLQGDKAYLILNLLSVEESKPLSYAEAKEKLVEGLKTDRIRETLSLKTADVRKQIEGHVKAGKSFVEAAQMAGLKAETLEAFSRSDSKLSFPDATVIQDAAGELKDGQISASLDGASGTLLVHVIKRQPVDPADLEQKKASLIPMLETQRTDGLLSEWVDRRRAAAGLQLVDQR